MKPLVAIIDAFPRATCFPTADDRSSGLRPHVNFRSGKQGIRPDVRMGHGWAVGRIALILPDGAVTHRAGFPSNEGAESRAEVRKRRDRDA